VTFYDEVMRELLAALGAAMFFGNMYALLRRRADAPRLVASRPGARPRASKRGPTPAPRSTSTRRPGSTGRQTGELTQAPVLRTVVYVVLGFVMMIAGIASLALS
jgi:hypothetical protein